MSRISVHIIPQRFDDGVDGVAQWIEKNRIRTRRLDQSPTQLKKFFSKFKYVILNRGIQDMLQVSRSQYLVSDFLAILLDRRP